MVSVLAASRSPAPFPVLSRYPHPESRVKSRHAYIHMTPPSQLHGLELPLPYVPSLPRRPTTSSPCPQVVTSNSAIQCQRIAAPCLLRKGPHSFMHGGFELGLSKLA